MIDDGYIISLIHSEAVSSQDRNTLPIVAIYLDYNLTTEQFPNRQEKT
jgi:hypothetical protein